MDRLTQLITTKLLSSTRNTNNVNKLRLSNDNAHGKKMSAGNFWKNDSSLLTSNDLLITTSDKTNYIPRKYNSLNTFYRKPLRNKTNSNEMAAF